MTMISGCRVSRELLCLIFVDRIVTAKVIERFMRKVTSLSHFKISYLTGSTTSVDALTPKIQKETLKLFSSGEVNNHLWCRKNDWLMKSLDI